MVQNYIHSPLAAIGLFTTAAIGFVFNVVTLVKCTKIKEHKKVSSIGIINLLSINILQTAITIPCYGLLQFDWSLEINTLICDVFLFTHFLSLHVTLFSMIFITMDRVITLNSPLHYQKYLNSRNVITIIILSWLTIIIIDLLPFLNQNGSLCHYQPSAQWSIVTNVLFKWIFFVFVLLGWVYIIKLALKHQRKLNTTMYGHNDINIAKLKATKLALFLLGSYLLSYGPSALYYLLLHVCRKECFQEDFIKSKRDYVIRFIVKMLFIYVVHTHFFLLASTVISRLFKYKCQHGSV